MFRTVEINQVPPSKAACLKNTTATREKNHYQTTSTKEANLAFFYPEHFKHCNELKYVVFGSILQCN